MPTWTGMPHFFSALRAAFNHPRFSSNTAHTLSVFVGGLAVQLTSATSDVSTHPSNNPRQITFPAGVDGTFVLTEAMRFEKGDEFSFIHHRNVEFCRFCKLTSCTGTGNDLIGRNEVLARHARTIAGGDARFKAIRARTQCRNQSINCFTKRRGTRAAATGRTYERRTYH